MRIQILILGFKALNTDCICLGLQASLTFHIRRSRLLTSANMNVRTDDLFKFLRNKIIIPLGILG